MTTASPAPRLAPLIRRWEARAAVPDHERHAALLAAELKLPDPLCRLLALRGLTDCGAARDHLKPRLVRLHVGALLG